MQTNNQPSVIIIAGANGSGKTTFALEYLQENTLPFLNADEIAKELNSENVGAVQLSAGREYFKRLNNLINSQHSFMFESTLSGRGTKRILEKLKASNYIIKIIYLFLHTPEICKARVRERVSNGGHHVPDVDIERRYWRSKNNFWCNYKNMVDHWSIYYNSNDSFEEVAYGSADWMEVTNEELLMGFMEGVKS